MLRMLEAVPLKDTASGLHCCKDVHNVKLLIDTGRIQHTLTPAQPILNFYQRKAEKNFKAAQEQDKLSLCLIIS